MAYNKPFTLEERKKIEALLKDIDNVSLEEIAVMLKRSLGGIKGEIKRGGTRFTYNAEKADVKAKKDTELRHKKAATSNKGLVKHSNEKRMRLLEDQIKEIQDKLKRIDDK